MSSAAVHPCISEAHYRCSCLIG